MFSICKTKLEKFIFFYLDNSINWNNNQLRGQVLLEILFQIIVVYFIIIIIWNDYVK